MNSNDLTQGPVARTLARFAYPVLISVLLQTLYGLVDVWTVSKFSDAAATAAVSAGSLIMATVNYSIIGLSSGGAVLIGQLFGARREDELHGAARTLFTLVPLIALGVAVVLAALTIPLLRLINTNPEAFAGTRNYLWICLAGLFFTAGYNSVAAALRGVGDSKRPLMFIIIACVVNIAGDLLLVAVFDMGAEGAAIATTAAQVLCMVLGLIYLKRSGSMFSIRLRELGFVRGFTRKLLSLGVPMALQEVLVMTSFIVIEAFINDFGYISTAAAGIADKFFTVALAPTSAFSSAIAAMVAQNMGAGRPDRMRKSLLVGASISLGVALAFFAWAQLAPASTFRLFTKDEAIIAAGCQYLQWYKYDFPLCAVIFCINGFINGAGRPRFTLINNVVSTYAIRIPLCILFCRLAHATLGSVSGSFPIASAVQLVVAAAFVLSGRWRLARDEGLSEQ